MQQTKARVPEERWNRLPDTRFQAPEVDADHGRDFDRRHPRAAGVVGRAVRPVTGSVVEQAFQKDLSHLSWNEVYARQTRRAGLVAYPCHMSVFTFHQLFIFVRIP